MDSSTLTGIPVHQNKSPQIIHTKRQKGLFLWTRREELFSAIMQCCAPIWSISTTKPMLPSL